MTDHILPLIHIIAPMDRPAPGHRFVFAYDEEMDIDRFRKRCPEAFLVATARIRNRRWIANSDGRATVARGREFDVYGVVFEVPEAAEMALAERYPPRTADRYGAFARSTDDTIMPVEYFAPVNHRHGEAGWEILQVLAAARYYRFPEAYLSELAQWVPGPVEFDGLRLVE